MEKTTKKAEYRSSIRSRMLIQSALLDLMAEKDISKITVIDVVNRANINRGTFYAHYSDLNDVLEQISNRTIERMQEIMLQCVSTDDVGSLLTNLTTQIGSDLALHRQLSSSPAVKQFIEKLREIFVSFMVEHAKPERRSDPAYMLKLRYCSAGIINLFVDWLDGRVDLTLEELSRQLSDLTVHFLP